MNDFLGCEALIIERLKNKASGVKAVLSAADLADVAEKQQTTPALHVISGGWKPTAVKPGSGGMLSAEFEQIWLVVVAVRNVRSAKTGTDARAEAGPILAATLKALLGWRPSNEFQPFKPAPAPKPGFSAGYGYFPLAFTTKTVVAGEP